MNNEEVLKEDGRHRLKGRPRPEGAGRQKTDKLLTNTSFRVDRETLDQFKEACSSRNTTYGKVLRSFMREYVEEVSKSCEEVSDIEKVEEV